MEIGDILFIVFAVVILTLILYAAAGIVSGDWNHTGGLWARFILIAACSTVIIPTLQSFASFIYMSEIGLLIAFVVIMLLIRFLLMPEMTVADEWMATIFASLLVVLILYVTERIADALFDIGLFHFL